MPTLTWPLVPDPAPPAPAPPSTETTAGRAAEALRRGLPAFLGRGVLRPFRRDGKADFANADGLRLIVSCAGQVLGTKADTVRAPGELPWRTDFGSRFHLLRHRNQTTQRQTFAQFLAQEALGKWEPRVRVTTVTLPSTGDTRTLAVLVKFDLVDRLGNVLMRGLETSVTLETDE